mmetsp:Transcript_33031/g.47741  ORF Transcript_33031/g.47741 Transcript_33031/m.47741 type:complete len:380 (-) Transcript_33031:282-1421(-)
MFKADQRVVFEQTNQAIIDIRKAEIDYFVSVNTTCGTQAALIGGFIYSVFTQDGIGMDDIVPNLEVALTIYYILSAISLAAAIHVIICTMLLQVLGPGLALHGPVGSMAIAVKGLRAEQDHVIVAFVIMIIFFALSTILSFWVVFDFPAALTSSVIFVAASYVWFVDSQRIRLRFHWNSTDLEMSANRSGESVERGSENPGNWIPRSDVLVDSKQTNESATYKPPIGSIANTTTNANNTNSTVSPLNHSFPSQITSTVQKHHPLAVAMEGYLGTRDKEKWERKYVTVNYRGDLYFYLSRIKYRSDPLTNRMNQRPIQLENYSILLPTSNASESERADQLIIELIYKGEEKAFKKWLLRTDTAEEFDIWSSVLLEISRST